MATWQQIKEGAEIFQGNIFGKNPPPRVAIFGGKKKKLIAPHLDHRFFMLLVYKGVFFLNLVFSLTCSQISLITLVDDHHSTYITKLREEKE